MMSVRDGLGLCRHLRWVTRAQSSLECRYADPTDEHWTGRLAPPARTADTYPAATIRRFSGSIALNLPGGWTMEATSIQPPGEADVNTLPGSLIPVTRRTYG
jgi:hypothetical protein